MEVVRHAVRLGTGRLIPLGVYVAGWKRCLELPPETPLRRGVTGWWPTTVGETLADLRAGMDDRINRHLPWFGAGRKWQSDFQRHLRLAASAVNTPRLAVRWHNFPDVMTEYGRRLRDRIEMED